MISLITSWITSCTVHSPFQKSEKLQNYNLTDESIVIVALTQVETGFNPINLATFWSRVMDVRSSLDTNPGYLGGSIRRQLIGSKAWTMTVWKDSDSLDDFIYSKTHEKAMKDGAPAVNKSIFYRIKKKWKEIPIDWETAVKEIEENGREH
jgi:heme-degrading monooxygenase HmoA